MFKYHSEPILLVFLAVATVIMIWGFFLVGIIGPIIWYLAVGLMLSICGLQYQITLKEFTKVTLLWYPAILLDKVEWLH